MHTLSHPEPINLQGSATPPEMFLLADAFTEFISASASLEASYEKLQLEVAYLSSELAERNTDLKLSLAENERVHHALKQIVSSMPCGVLVVEWDGAVSMLNPEARNLLGLEESTASDLGSISMLAGLDLTGFLERHARMEGEQEFCLSSHGAKRWLSVHKRSLTRGVDGMEPGAGQQVILILRDVTAHKQAEIERERARRATALSEVATTLAHEIRNPLTSLELFAGLIARAGNENVAEYVSHLHAGIRSLAGTVNNVLSLHGGGFPSMTPVDLVQSLRSSVAFVRPIADEAGVSLAFESDGNDLRVHGNGSALQQLVLNMVCNAIRHTLSGGQIEVKVEAGDAGFARISFSDTGCGIDPAHLDQIFRLGFSGNGSSSGLGLAVCTQIVEQHHGRLSVMSRVGVGTTFTVEVPSL